MHEKHTLQREGPPLEVLLRRLLETPSEFLAEPRIGSHGDIDVAAVVWDVLRESGGRPPTAKELSPFRPWGLAARSKRWLAQRHKTRRAAMANDYHG